MAHLGEDRLCGVPCISRPKIYLKRDIRTLPYRQESTGGYRANASKAVQPLPTHCGRQPSLAYPPKADEGLARRRCLVVPLAIRTRTEAATIAREVTIAAAVDRMPCFAASLPTRNSTLRTIANAGISPRTETPRPPTSLNFAEPVASSVGACRSAIINSEKRDSVLRR